jgi:chromosome segregation ATPase
MQAPRGRSVFHDVPVTGFLIGSVPGCDLRLPGMDVAAVLCLVTPGTEGATVRKLLPTQAVLINGRAVTTGPLADGDRLTVGPVELRVHIQSVTQARSKGGAGPELLLRPGRVATSEEDAATGQPDQWPQAVDRREQELAAREELLRHQQAELVTTRQQLSEIRQQLYDRYRERRDRLAGLQEAIGVAARKIQERKRQLDEEHEQAGRQSQEQADVKLALEHERRQLVDERRELEDRAGQLAGESADLLAREQHGIKERQALEKSQAQHQSDLVRLDRLRASLDQRQQQLQERAREVDQRFEQMQRTSRALEEQAAELEECRRRLIEEGEQLARKKEEQEVAAAQAAERAAALEGQQAMVAALRTRLERLRDELRHEQQELAEQRNRLTASEAELQRRHDEADTIRQQLDQEREVYRQQQETWAERQGLLDEAVTQLHQAQETLAAREAELAEGEHACTAVATEQGEQRRALEQRSEQLVKLQQQVQADRDALQEREQALIQLEQARGALQEQLRRRAEELAQRHRLQVDQDRQQEEKLAVLQNQRAQLEEQRVRMQEQLEAGGKALDTRAMEIARLEGELSLREEKLAEGRQRLKQVGMTLARARKLFSAHKTELEERNRQAVAELEQARAEVEARRQRLGRLEQQLPDLELRAQAAVGRLAQAREQLGEHLGELNNYARQSQADLESWRAQIQVEAEQARQQQLALHRAREEHRLAVAAFRQQLIAWQGQLTDMRRTLAQGETRLERRQAQVDEQARQLDASSARLAHQAEALQEQERVVVERRQEMEQHLNDLRDWYRRKLRELSERRRSEQDDKTAKSRGTGEPAATFPAQASATEDRPTILALPSADDDNDRKLGELLRSLELVDAETLAALLTEARRQRRSLRQALLAGGYLTLYQMALIETGDLDGLMLGPLRVVDRLRVTAHEAVYRVFDPRRGHEAILRHLAEPAAMPSERVEEFRSSFQRASGLRHPHVRATFEVLDIAGRPAALQECLLGLASTDWPALAAVPGVWYRLVCQAALALHTAHAAGLVHGHLDGDQFVLTGEGILKLCGLCEPAWLRTPPVAAERVPDVASDLLDLGRLAAGWSALAARRKGTKMKPLPQSLQAILARLTEATGQGYASAAALLEDLDQAGTDVPANAEAWDRLLRHVRDQAAEEARVRQSA